MIIDSPFVDQIVDIALREDLGTGDVSARVISEGLGNGSFHYLAKEDFVLCGTNLARRVFASLDETIEVEFARRDGVMVKKGDVIGSVSGPIKTILSGERTSLNFIQRMSGIATLTRRYQQIIGDAPLTLLDTRKTTPGWRVLEKYAVRTGGGTNHRMGLFDGIMLKDNHIDAAGSIPKAVQLARKNSPITVKIEVECRNVEDVKVAVDAGADIVMLDNFDPDDIRAAVSIAKGHALTEVSGRVREDRLPEIAKSGVDFVSVGALTHQAVNVDISLKLTTR